jgi:enamine deaminase RidA (YjgF/YER057c/UK114 family)
MRQKFSFVMAIAMAAFMGGSITRAFAQSLKNIPLTASQNPSGANRPFSQGVWAGDTLYVSGWLDPDLKAHTDTASQTAGILKDIQAFLKTQHLTLGDVAMVRVYLAADPAKGGQMDIDGFRAGYYPFFGTKEQPNKPACTTVQVVLPAGRRGALVEIDVVAVRSK